MTAPGAGLDGADLDRTARAVVAAAAAWARDFVAGRAEDWERERRFAREAFDAAAAAGFTALTVPVADGGSGLGPVALARVFEEIAAVDLAVAFSLVCHNNLAGAVSRLAPPALRERALPALVSGEKIGAFLLTEPDVGSDVAAIGLTAKRDGDDWVLDGDKAWVTNGTAAGLLSVYAQTDPSRGHRGIAAFLVDVPADAASAAAAGVVREDPYPLLGGHAAGVNGITFRQCRVGDDDLLVPPGEGFAAALSGIDLARVLVSAMCCGMMRTALETAVDCVRRRQAFGARVADFQGVRFALADVATDLEAARLLAGRAARALESGETAALAAAHAKKFATRAAERRIADCMQAMGAAGARRDHPLPRHLAMARLTQYMDGTTEIQNVVIARALLD